MRKLVTLCCLGLLLQGCATIMQGSKQSIPVSGSPAGATVILNGQIMGSTPLILKVARKEDHTLTIEKEGYEPTEIELKRRFSVLFIGNILIGGLVGMGVDAATGAMYDITPDTIQVNLRQIEHKP